MKITIKLVLICLLTFVNMAVFAQHEIPNLKKPSSWNQYLDSVVESGDLGTWRASGVTKDLWVGIPAGIRYVSNETIDISHDKKKLLMAHEYISEDGKMLSIGSGFVGWDPVAKRIYSFYSGYDGGKPFWGPRELVGFSSKGVVWKYTETSRGVTYETLQVSKRTNKNSRTNITKKTDGTGEIIEVNLRKVISADIAGTEVEKKDRAAIHQLIVEWERAFNAHDAKAVAATYAQQAESLDQSGMKLVKGREAIQRQVQTSLNENPNVKTKQTELEVRFLSPTLAVQTGYWNDDGLETEFDKRRSNGMWTSVVKKIDGKWLYFIDRFWPEQQSE